MLPSLATSTTPIAIASAATAGAPAFPSSFTTQEIEANGTTIHVRIGGAGPAVVLLHGYGETGDMWARLAADLARDHRVIAPDLRGLGLSAKPAGGYDKKTQGADIAGVLDALHVERADLVTHDIGNMVGYAFAAQYPERVVKFVIIDAPLPGIGPWDDIIRNHALWHFSFYGPEAERLVEGRERIYLDRFWNEFSADPAKWDEASREHYASIRRDASGLRAVRRVRSGCDRQQGITFPRQTYHAGIGDRRRAIFRVNDGDGHAFCGFGRPGSGGPAGGPLAHGRAARDDDPPRTPILGSALEWAL